jgi:hypothetical protein
MIIRATRVSIAAALVASVVMALGADAAAAAIPTPPISQVAVNPQPLPPGVARFDQAVYAIALNSPANVYPSSDPTIHALPEAGPADADWFSLTLAPAQKGQWEWWYADVTLNVPDTQYADLQVQVFAPNTNNPNNPTLIQPVFSQDSSQGMAALRAPLQLGQTYLIKVSGVNAGDSNCYDNLTVRLPDVMAPNPNAIPGRV